MEHKERTFLRNFAYNLIQRTLKNKPMGTETKNFFASKLNWLGIAMVATAVGDYVSKFETGTWDWKTVTLFSTGLLTIIIRTWFTSTAIK